MGSKVNISDYSKEIMQLLRRGAKAKNIQSYIQDKYGVHIAKTAIMRYVSINDMGYSDITINEKEVSKESEPRNHYLLEKWQLRNLRTFGNCLYGKHMPNQKKLLEEGLFYGLELRIKQLENEDVILEVIKDVR